MVILDTSVIIDHLRRKQNAMTVLRMVQRRYGLTELAVTTITIQELYEGKSTRDPQELDRMEAMLRPLRILSYSQDIAQQAGMLARDLGRPIEFTDAVIAATTIAKNAQLLTLNQKDFANIPQLELLEI